MFNENSFIKKNLIFNHFYLDYGVVIYSQGAVPVTLKQISRASNPGIKSQNFMIKCLESY